MAATVIAHEIFSDRRAEAMQSMRLHIDFGDVLKLSDVVCDAPHLLGRRHETETRLAAMENEITNPVRAEKPQWTMGAEVHVQTCMLMAISEAWWKGRERDGSGMCDVGSLGMYCGLGKCRNPG